MRKTIVVFLMLLASSLGLAAQDTPSAEVFGGYSLLHAHTLVGDHNASGWDGSIAGNFNRWFGLKADFSGHYTSIAGIAVRDHNFLFGPQISYRTDKLTPFAHLLLGGSHLSGDFPSDTSLAWALGGGVDWNVLPRVAVRLVQADLLQTRFGDDNQNNGRFSFGVIFKFGGK